MKIFKTKYMVKKYLRSILLFLAVALILSLGSCDLAKISEKKEKAAIQNYLDSHSDLIFELKPSGLYYREVLTGTGRALVTHDIAYIMLTVRFLDESLYYTNEATTDTLTMPVAEGAVIYGLDEGVSFMRVGGKSSLIIPSRLAFGASGNDNGIGGYTALLYDIQVVRVKPGSGK
jgi:FKBP-type peptidyl-prolyl cis-trans isomerase FkpA